MYLCTGCETLTGLQRCSLAWPCGGIWREPGPGEGAGPNYTRGWLGLKWQRANTRSSKSCIYIAKEREIIVLSSSIECRILRRTEYHKTVNRPGSSKPGSRKVTSSASGAWSRLAISEPLQSKIYVFLGTS